MRECRRQGSFPESRGEVRTVTEAGWRGAKDGPLLALAQKSFDVFVTIDCGLEHQQALTKLDLGILIAHVPNNKVASYRPLFQPLLRAAETVHGANNPRAPGRMNAR